MRLHRIRRRALLAGALNALPASAAQFVNVLTGGTSGVYYPLGVAVLALVFEGTRRVMGPARPSSAACS